MRHAQYTFCVCVWDLLDTNNLLHTRTNKGELKKLQQLKLILKYNLDLGIKVSFMPLCDLWHVRSSNCNCIRYLWFIQKDRSSGEKWRHFSFRQVCSLSSHSSLLSKTKRRQFIINLNIKIPNTYSHFNFNSNFNVKSYDESNDANKRSEKTLNNWVVVCTWCEYLISDYLQVDD